ncbi:MAG: sugar-transfer associated ATP-grasp domain-containing protein [Gemmatimonadota bacterium]
MSSALRFLQRTIAIATAEDIPVWQQWHDLWRFHRLLGMSPGEFDRYDLWDRRRPLTERVAYLSHAEHRIIEKAVNPADAVRALNDKILTTQRLVAAGIPMPKLLGVIGGMSATTGAPTSASIATALSALAAAASPGGIVIKPNRGQGGHGVEVFPRTDRAGLVRPDGSVVSIAAVAAMLANRPVAQWKVEEWLAPHPATARFAPESLATVRILTFRAPDGRINVGPATLKLPIDASGVDNFGAGNLAAPLDLTTGRLGPAVHAITRGKVVVHPRTGERIEDAVLPQVEALVQLASAAAEVLNELTILGWDIALTTDGPRVIEGNAWWSELILQKPHGRGIVAGRFAELLEEHGLGELIEKRRSEMRDER